MDPVTVYEFEVFDSAAGQWVRSPRVGTLDAIRSVRGIAIRSTAMVVSADRVGEDGFVRPPGSAGVSSARRACPPPSRARSDRRRSG